MKCKYCGQDGFKNKKGLSVHRRFNLECYEKWEKEQKEIEKKKTKVECLLCHQKLRNISNTHLKKHNITQQQYKILFPNAPLFSEGLLEEQKEKREKTMQKRYTKDEIKYLKGKKSVFNKEKKQNKSISEIQKEIFKNFKENNPEKYKENNRKKIEGLKLKYKKMTPEERKKFNNARLLKRIKTNLLKYGTQFPQSLDEIKNKTKATKKEKYGDENYFNRQKYYETMYKNYGKYSNFFPHFSWTSQELFKKIEEKIGTIKCYYAINGEKNENNEFQVLIGKKFVRFLDFYIPDLNKWIEFDEKHHNYENNIKKDIKKEKEVFGKIKKIKLLRITEEEFLKNENKTIKKCLNFIYL